VSKGARSPCGVAPFSGSAAFPPRPGLGAWAYDRHWQIGVRVLVGFAAWPFLTALYPLPAWIFDWPQIRWIDAILNGLDLLDVIVSLLSIFS
jgi:hypothetical protein